MPGVCPEGGGGMLKLRFDRYITELLRVSPIHCILINNLQWPTHDNLLREYINTDLYF